MLAFALLSTGFPCELIHNFVINSVFRLDFDDFFFFITLNRVLWLAKLNWSFHECSLLCWGYLVLEGFELLALALLMGGLMLKHVERPHRGGTSQTPLAGIACHGLIA